MLLQRASAPQLYKRIYMKRYVLDTNVLILEPQSISAFEDNVVIIPFKVMEELDNIKSRSLDISRDARFAIRLLEDVIADSTHEEISNTGVPLNRSFPDMPDSAKLKVITREDSLKCIEHLGQYKTLVESTVPDDEIILVALATNAILVTRDINMRIKAMAYGVEVQDYRHDVSVSDADLIHIGNYNIDVDIWKELENRNAKVFTENEKGKKLRYYILADDITFLPENVCIGDYIYDNSDVMLVFEGFTHLENEDGDFAVFLEIGKKRAMNKKVWDITPINIEQSMAIDSILDPDVHITVLLGSAGTGKTLITLASALELALEKNKYSRVVFSKTQDSQFEDIGFLPGTEAEKVIPFCGAAIDALEFMHRKDANPQGSIEEIMKRNVLQFKALNFIRGRSFSDTILIIDEFQNITPAQAKTILTRAGENCKVIIMGNLNQIDNRFISPVNSGLTYVTEKFKDWEGCRIIELQGVVRSALAEYAEKNL